MKIGDYIKSDFWAVEGVIKDLRPCPIPHCERFELSLEEDSPTRFYYHSEFFVISSTAETQDANRTD